MKLKKTNSLSFFENAECDCGKHQNINRYYQENNLSFNHSQESA